MDEWLELYKKGKSAIKIAEEFGVPQHKVYRFLNKQNVKMRTTKDTARKYTLNHDYFAKIDTEEKAYWLGFIFADGYVLTNDNSFGVALHSRDEDHLYKLKNSLNATYPVKKFTGKTTFTDNFQYSRIICKSEKAKSDLIRLGCVPNKSLILEFPDNKKVPKRLKNDFVRGYFDGDGSLTSCKGKEWNLKICGTSGFLIELSNFYFDNVTGLYKEARNSNNNFYLNLHGVKRDLLLDKMYAKSNIHLDRKYEKYLIYKNYYSRPKK